MKEKRDRNEVKINQQRHYDTLADATFDYCARAADGKGKTWGK